MLTSLFMLALMTTPNVTPGPAPATSVVASARSTDATRNDAALAAVRELFAALEAGDIPRFLKVWADDGVQEMPYAPGAFPRLLEGKAAIEKQYAPLPNAFSGMKFPVRRLVATTTPGLVFAELDGSITLKTGGRYDNRYVGVFQFNEAGKLARYTEYFDPITLINGFPGAAALGAPDSDRVRESVLALARFTDARDWKADRALFAEIVDVDYTSVAGGKPATVKADALIADWAKGLSSYRSTKHNFSDIVVKVDGDTAIATFSGQATHLKNDNTRWNCGGDYTMRLTRTSQGFRITALRFDMKWELGAR